MVHADEWPAIVANVCGLLKKKKKIKYENQAWKSSLMDDVFLALIVEPSATFIKLCCFHLRCFRDKNQKTSVLTSALWYINKI